MFTLTTHVPEGSNMNEARARLIDTFLTQAAALCRNNGSVIVQLDDKCIDTVHSWVYKMWGENNLVVRGSDSQPKGCRFESQSILEQDV